MYFPHSVVTIRRLQLYASDEGGNAVCINLHRVDPVNGSGAALAAGSFCSTGSSSGNPREFTRTNLSDRRILQRRGAYMNAYVPNGDYIFYGAKITYGH